MRVKRKNVIITLVALILPIGIPLLATRIFASGPTAPAPTEDPLLALNRERADVPDNAAETYARAWEALAGGFECAWLDEPPLPPGGVEWVAKNAEAIELTRQAARMANCWFPLATDSDGMLLWDDIRKMRKLVRLQACRRQLAADQHDLETLADCVVTINAIARHMAQTPELMRQYTATSFAHSSLGLVLVPLTWAEFSEEQLDAYAARVEPCWQPLPKMTEALEFGARLEAWSNVKRAATEGGTAMWLFNFSPDRIYGEIKRLTDPHVELAELPVEQQLDPDNPIRLRIIEMEGEETPVWCVARWLAKMVPAWLSSTVDNRATLVARQRGHQTVLVLFLYRARHGQFPETLTALEGEYTIDPFTAQPFIYRLTESGFTLYSVGANRVDEGGRHNRRYGLQPSMPGGDFVFWPIPRSDVE